MKGAWLAWIMPSWQKRESNAALLTEELLAGQVLLEAREVCGLILSLFSANSHDILEEEFVALLPGVEDVELSCR
jgi:hypothetical protein